MPELKPNAQVAIDKIDSVSAPDKAETQLRAGLAGSQKTGNKIAPKYTAPRYDEVYIKGVEWLDSL